MLQAAQMAEDDFLMITRVSPEAVGLSQAFVGNSPCGGGSSNSIIGAYPSQAEDTMQHYAPGGGHSTDGSASTQTGERRSRRFFACHGCGGPHPWMEFKNGEHTVVCPNRNNPGICENAKKNIDRMKANRRKRARHNTKRKNLGTVNFVNFNAAGQDRIREQVLLTLKNGFVRHDTQFRHPCRKSRPRPGRKCRRSWAYLHHRRYRLGCRTCPQAYDTDRHP